MHRLLSFAAAIAIAGLSAASQQIASAQTAGSSFTVTVNAVDTNWNVVSSTDTVAITSSDSNATLLRGLIWCCSLLDDEAGNPAAVTRDYQLDLDRREAPLLTVWGVPLASGYRRPGGMAVDDAKSRATGWWLAAGGRRGG